MEICVPFSTGLTIIVENVVRVFLEDLLLLVCILFCILS